AVQALAHTLFALRREGTGRGTHRLDLAEIGRRLEVNLLGESVRLLRGGPLVVVPTGKLHAVPWGLLPSLRERATAVTPSASAWLRARRAPRPEDDQVVLVGGPRLVSALISLGSAGVVASVVPVNDPATVPLMTALHDHLRAGSDLASALTLARRAVSDDPVAQATACSFIALGT